MARIATTRATPRTATRSRASSRPGRSRGDPHQPCDPQLRLWPHGTLRPSHDGAPIQGLLERLSQPSPPGDGEVSRRARAEPGGAGDLPAVTLGVDSERSAVQHASRNV